MITYGSNILLMLGLPIWMITRVITLYKRSEQNININIGKEIAFNLFIFYIFILVGIIFFPITIGSTFTDSTQLNFFERCNIYLIPMMGNYTRGVTLVALKQIIGNLLLLVPFILYLCVVKVELRNIHSAILTAFNLAIGKEFIQLILNITGLSLGKVIHIDHIILNTLGGIIAWLIFKLLYKGRVKESVDNINLELS